MGSDPLRSGIGGYEPIMDELPNYTATGQLFPPKPDDPCPDHPDNENDCYPHTPTFSGRCGVCDQELDMNKYDEMCADDPEDGEDELPYYRIGLKGCDESTYVEMQLDAADLEVLRRVREEVRKITGHSKDDDYGCEPNMGIWQRIKPGDVGDDRCFRPL